MLMCVSFHFVNVAADWMVMPFSRSSSMLSILAPTPSLPLTCTGLCRGLHAMAFGEPCQVVAWPDKNNYMQISMYVLWKYIYLMNSFDAACVKENPLCERRLPGIDVCADPDVANM